MLSSGQPPVVKRLINCIAHEPDKEKLKEKEKTIKLLVKKMQKLQKPDMIYSLERAVTSQDSSTPCITVPRSVDGRLQVGQRKGLPHIIFCQVFRWPELSSHHEVRAIASCQYSFYAKREEVCINPYHYHRTLVPPVVVPSGALGALPTGAGQAIGGGGGGGDTGMLPSLDNLSLQEGGLSSSSSAMDTQPSLPPVVSLSPNAPLPDQPLTPILQHLFPASPCSPAASQVSSSAPLPAPSPGPSAAAAAAAAAASAAAAIGPTGHIVASPSGYMSEDSDLFGPASVASSTGAATTNSLPSPGLGVTPPLMPSPSSSSVNLAAQQQQQQQHQAGFPSAQQAMDISASTSASSGQLDAASSRHSLSGSSGSLQNGMQQQQQPMPMLAAPAAPQAAGPAVDYLEPAHWSQVSYYELQHRVGEAFHVSVPSITVDGYTDPDPSGKDRFCLGLLSNVNRTAAVEMTRRSIGRGLRLYYLGGEVFVECLSEAAIFVQSASGNFRYNWHPATVVRLPQGCNLKLFNNVEFAQLLAERVQDGYEAVHQLIPMCIIRISFVKGWGAQYQRPNITATPCWIEVHLNGPLQWLDRVLRQMPPPPGGGNSYS